MFHYSKEDELSSEKSVELHRLHFMRDFEFKEKLDATRLYEKFKRGISLQDALRKDLDIPK